MYAFVWSTCAVCQYCCVEQNRHSPLVMCGKCVCRVCSLCDGMCVTDTCPLLLQYEWTLLHSAALGGNVGLIEWLMANHKFEMEAKTKVLLRMPTHVTLKTLHPLEELTLYSVVIVLCINYYFCMW